MPATGSIQVYAYTSNARIPLKDVAISVTRSDGETIALRTTNRSGTLDAPISVEVPAISAGQSPNTGVIPFTSVNLYARAENYEAIEVEGLQVFPNTVTAQDLQLIPLSELPGSWNQGELFTTPPQNL